ncbi:MAG: zinc ribbon domain-containing protein, partial [Lachnospiraceae bacterium]|nr:zinc ribbon domain-containing protein [Lachnospiraceae bacterium]
MFCPECGTKIDDRAAFCPNCGTKIKAVAETPAAGAPAAGNPAAGAPVTGTPVQGPMGIPQDGPAKPAVNVDPKIVIAACAGALLFLIIIIAVINRKTVVDLNKYVKDPVFEGYDGYGAADTGFLFDEEAFIADYAGKIKYTGGNRSIANEYDTPEQMLADYANGFMDTGTGLSNGDTVEFKWTIDEELLKKLFKKCKLKYSDITYSVSGLTPLREVNPFDDIVVTFDGIAPNGSCSVEVDSEEDSVKSLYVSTDKNTGLSNGDTVKVKLACYYSDDIGAVMAESYGVILTETEKTYTVDGLESYVTDYADISEDFLTDSKVECEDIISAYAAKNYDDSKLGDLEYSGYIFETVKDTDDYYYEYNDLYLIYTGFVSSTKGSFEKTKVYYPVQFKNLLKATDGSVTGEKTDDIVGWGSLGGTWNSTDGYTNPLKCYEELVESKRDSYVATVGDGFEQYTEQSPIEGLDDIYDSCRTVLSDKAKEKIENYIESSYNEDVSVKNLAVDKEYLLLAKEPGTDYAINNKYYIIFSATVSHKEKSFEKTTVYYPVEYDGIVNFPNGEYLVSGYGDIVGSNYFEGSWYYTKGYMDADEMFKDIVTANRTQYTSDVDKNVKANKDKTEAAEAEEDKADADDAEDTEVIEETEEAEDTEDAGESEEAADTDETVEAEDTEDTE